MLKLVSHVFAELAIALILGGIPVVLILSAEGTEQMAQYIVGVVNPKLPLVLYTFALTFFVYPLAWVVDHFIVRDHRRSKYGTAFLVYVLQEAGSGTLSLYRVISGVCLTFAGTWIAMEPSWHVVIRSFHILSLGIGAWIAACVLFYIKEWFKRNTNLPLQKLQKEW